MRDLDFAQNRASEKIPWKALSERIEALGGLWILSGKDVAKYNHFYQALTKSCNPTLNTILEVLSVTGMTFEEAFAS